MKYIWDDVAYDETGKGYNIDQLNLFNARQAITGKSKLFDTAMYGYDNYIGESEKNSFDKSLGLSSLLNMYSIPKTLIDAQFGVSSSFASPQMKEELRKQIMSDIRRTGRTTGGISYEDLGFDTMYNSSGEHIDVSKNPGFRHPLGMNTAQQALGLTGGKMDYSVDPTTGKVTFTGGTDYDFGHLARKFPNTEWNPNLSVDPSLIKQEMNLFNPAERSYQQGLIQMQPPKEVIRDSADHYRAKFEENKKPYTVIEDPFTPVQPVTQPITQPITQPVTQPPVQPRVNNVSPGGGNSRRGPSYAQQARTVNRKAKSMGVASPIRRSGNKYGFGL